ncbi:MAG: cell division protein ZapA [Lachnospiraceae bacterium]|nr:cell division protein ZapA [Clostridiales bacterium]MDD6294030.1 cell division protein ZapA [Eubacteriales bacterium]MDY2607122.1 cell division protein ZapA [Lachnospiraceae bacterium]MDY6328147.1 cell division protein ZapA [Lachnospiraceae bacterium]
MSSKNNTEVIIDGKIFTLSGYESEEYLQKVATYINNKISEFKQDEAYKRQNIDVQKALLDLNIADDYFKAKKQADTLETELENKDKQLYEIKHELIAAQIKIETGEKESEDLKKQLSELQKEVIRLETRIQEMKEVQPKRTSSAKKDKTELN